MTVHSFFVGSFVRELWQLVHRVDCVTACTLTVRMRCRRWNISKLIMPIKKMSCSENEILKILFILPQVAPSPRADKRNPPTQAHTYVRITNDSRIWYVFDKMTFIRHSTHARTFGCRACAGICALSWECVCAREKCLMWPAQNKHSHTRTDGNIHHRPMMERHTVAQNTGEIPVAACLQLPFRSFSGVLSFRGDVVCLRGAAFLTVNRRDDDSAELSVLPNRAR